MQKQPDGSEWDQSNTHFDLGLEYLQNNDALNAVKEFDQAISLDPSKSNFFLERANAHVVLKNWNEAVADYTKFIQSNPTDKNSLVSALHHRASSLRKLKLFPAALDDYTQLIELKPKDALFLFDRGCTNRSAQNLEAAISDFTESIELDRMNATAYRMRSITYAEKGDLEHAAKDDAEACRLNPHYEPLYRR